MHDIKLTRYGTYIMLLELSASYLINSRQTSITLEQSAKYIELAVDAARQAQEVKDEMIGAPKEAF